MADDKQDTIAVRNALFTAADGKSLDAVMQGSIMAQAKLVVETAHSPVQARQILHHYFSMALDAVPTYWAERGRTGRDN